MFGCCYLRLTSGLPTLARMRPLVYVRHLSGVIRKRVGIVATSASSVIQPSDVRPHPWAIRSASGSPLHLPAEAHYGREPIPADYCDNLLASSSDFSEMLVLSAHFERALVRRAVARITAKS